jgi:hypothetical protein
MIQMEKEDLGRIRERIHRMSDSELLRYGQAARYMADPRNNAGEPNPSFQVQLDEARLEWRRRHSKLPLSESV